MASAESVWVQNPAVTQAAERFLSELEAHGMPEWVLEFAGPFKEQGARATVEEYISDAMGLVWQRWGRRYMGGDGLPKLQNMVFPHVYFGADGSPIFKFVIAVVDPEDALRLGRGQVSKDPGLSQIPMHNVVNTADTEDWKLQRGHIMDAFLPHGTLSDSVPELESMADSMVAKWRTPQSKDAAGLIDVRAWMHHTALAMFIRCMMGDERAYKASAGGADLLFQDTTPADSEDARGAFNLEDIGRTRKPEEFMKKLMGMRAFADRLLERAEAREKAGGSGGPLIDRLRVLDDEQKKMQNMFATLVAGHDTTAYTMQFFLVELARHPEMQDRVRAECLEMQAEVRRRGTPLTYDDLPRYELLTRCIMETLRLWNVAAIVFPRITSCDDTFKGASGQDVQLPAGSKFTFWYYGHHHSSSFWGGDAMEWNPDRSWQPPELQRAGADGSQPSARTPCSERFHPFSVPRRDCLGKGFALTEMRILLPRIITNFLVEIPEDEQMLGSVLPHENNSKFRSWSREIGGPPQPHSLRMKISPLSSSKL